MSGEPRAPKPAPCPICRRTAQAAFAPFCSARCADVDLGRWLGERYVIPGEDEDGEGKGEPDRHRDDA